MNNIVTVSATAITALLVLVAVAHETREWRRLGSEIRHRRAELQDCRHRFNAAKHRAYRGTTEAERQAAIDDMKKIAKEVEEA
ncbi:hypothetical protein [Streptomyces lavendulocolor]|uniref:hypothetical protein n=1 Tax=Streptomyces lavendulocolor TaxID=67316 RepID=UPI0033CBBAFE